MKRERERHLLTTSFYLLFCYHAVSYTRVVVEQSPWRPWREGPSEVGTLGHDAEEKTGLVSNCSCMSYALIRTPNKIYPPHPHSNNLRCPLSQICIIFSQACYWSFMVAGLTWGKCSSLIFASQFGKEGKGNRQASPNPTHEPHAWDQVHTCQPNRLRTRQLAWMKYYTYRIA